jgi:polysaccharide export outer membrane protein
MMRLTANMKRWLAAAIAATAFCAAGAGLRIADCGFASRDVSSAELAAGLDPGRGGGPPGSLQSAIRNPKSESVRTTVIPPNIRQCQALGPAAPYPIWGVDSLSGGCGAEVGWDARGMIPWQQFAQGEWVGHARTAQVPEYRLREGDQIAVYYRRTRDELSRPYELQVGDRILVESLTAGGGPVANQVDGGGAPKSDIGISRELVIQPDGTISVPLVGQVRATRRTVQSLREELEEAYKKFYRVPAITVTPIHVDTRLEDLLNTVDSRAGLRGGLQLLAVVTPAGKIQLPAVDSVFVQGLTPAEAKQEIDARYAAKIPGVEVTIDLAQRAPRFIYVVGEVSNPGRFELVGPTTAMQSIALAGGWRIGANLRQVVVFRRADDWRLMATMLDLRGAMYGRRPVPADDIWLNDSDIVLVTKTPIQQADELIEQLFTRGLYGVVPREVVWNLDSASSSSL